MKNITIQQALFGYDSGHNLLESSCVLSPESRRELATLTDSPGPWPAVGYDHIYTGGLLPDSSYYALFCTWPAFELPRPGCVWSHVLLIELADLATLTDLEDLRSLFKRPKTERGKLWSAPIVYHPLPETKGISGKLSEVNCSDLLWGLYGKPNESFFVESKDGEVYEEAIFSIWEQQWPKLRRAFRFSTGSFSDRGRIGVSFDLQVVPSKSTQRNIPSEIIKHDSKSVSDERILIDEWVAAARADLMEPSKALREFLRANGSETESPRKSFALLVSIFVLIKKADTLELSSLLSNVAELFPSPSQAIKLKLACLSSYRSKNLKEKILFYWSVLHFLQSDASSAFQSVPADFDEIAGILWEHDREGLLTYVEASLNVPLSPHTQRLITSIASKIKGRELADIYSSKPHLLTALIRARPALALKSSAQLLPERARREILNVLDKVETPEGFWSDYVSMMLREKSEFGLAYVMQQAGDSGVEGALKWFNASSEQNHILSPHWREALWRSAGERVHTQAWSPKDLAFLVTLLPPSAASKISADREDVQSLARTSLSDLPPDLRTYAAFFLTALALQSSCKMGASLLANSFFTVHKALATSSEPWEAWLMLEPFLPTPYFWPTWDKCNSLRNGVAEWLRNCPKTLSSLYDACTNEEDFLILEKLSR